MELITLLWEPTTHTIWAEDDPIEHVIGTDGLSDNDYFLITGGNACKLFKIV